MKIVNHFFLPAVSLILFSSTCAILHNTLYVSLALANMGVLLKADLVIKMVIFDQLNMHIFRIFFGFIFFVSLCLNYLIQKLNGLKKMNHLLLNGLVTVIAFGFASVTIIILLNGVPPVVAMQTWHGYLGLGVISCVSHIIFQLKK